MKFMALLKTLVTNLLRIITNCYLENVLTNTYCRPLDENKFAVIMYYLF